MDYTMNKKLSNLSKILLKINLPYEALFISKLANNEELTREQEDKIINRYVKILAHAESGVGNEKANAQKRRDEHLEKYPFLADPNNQLRIQKAREAHGSSSRTTDSDQDSNQWYDFSGNKDDERFSNDNESLSGQSFVYLNPFGPNGELLPIDGFVEKWVKKGVIPISGSVKIMAYYPQIIKTLIDIYEVLDEDMANSWLVEIIGLMKMEDSMYDQSRLFHDIDERPEEPVWGSEEWQDENDKWEFDTSAEAFKKNINLIEEQKSKMISGPTGPLDENLDEDHRKALSAIETMKDIDKGKFIKSLGKEVFSYIRDNKDHPEIIEYVKDMMIDEYFDLQLYRIYPAEDYDFAESFLESLVLGTPDRRERGYGAWESGIDIFFKHKLWTITPDFFLEIIADKFPKKLIESDVFKDKLYNNKTLLLLSKAILDADGLFEINNIPAILFWLSPEFPKNNIPSEHFSRAIGILAQDFPAHFLSLTLKDGRKVSDLPQYREMKDNAEYALGEEAQDMAENNPIAFLKDPVDNITSFGPKTLWKDIYPDLIPVASNAILDNLSKYNSEPVLSFFGNNLHEDPRLNDLGSKLLKEFYEAHNYDSMQLHELIDEIIDDYSNWDFEKKDFKAFKNMKAFINNNK